LTSYPAVRAARILGVSAGRLRYWQRRALVQPSVRVGSHREFGFRDLVCGRQLIALLQNGVSLQRIRRTVEALHERVPELERPLPALRIWLDNSLVVAHRGGLLEPTGQFVLDLAGARRDGVAASSESEAKDAPDSDAALEWFECGLAVESDPETYAQAAEFYQRAIAADPRFADAHCNLGAVYANQGKRDRARQCYERALDLDPEHVEANFNLAMFLEAEGRDEAALAHLQRVLARDPMHSEGHLSLALLYEKLDRARAALPHWRRYLQLDPGGAFCDLARRRLDA
jgi:tetratricopeptide (TPR) repeat protein